MGELTCPIKPSLCCVKSVGVHANSPGAKEGEDGVEIVVKEMAEAHHYVEGNGLQEAHHLYVLANEPKDGEGCVGDNGSL